MFRRSEKNLQEESASYMYGAKRSEIPSSPDMPTRFFEEKTHYPNAVKEEPETTLGEGVTFRGELTFERLLRIDGTFEGELISQGKVIVGPKGRVKANLNLKEAIIEGRVEGNITVQERLELRGEACVHGDIEAKFLSIDEGVALIGHVHVAPPSSI